MKLQKYKKFSFKSVIIIAFTFLCVGLIAGVFFFSSFASFETNTTIPFMNGNVEDLGDVYFAYYIDGKVTLNAPEKNSSYVFDTANSSCTNGASVRWNYERWAAVVSNMNKTRTKCNLAFKTEYNESILMELIQS